MSISNKNATPVYTAIMITYCMGTCVSITFASVFLRGLGYTNTELGIILALTNIVGMVLGLFLGTLLDTHETLTASDLTLLLIVISLLAHGGLFLYNQKGFLSSALFLISGSMCIAINPINMKLNIDLIHNKNRLNFSFARAMGTVGYVSLSLVLGNVVTLFGIRMLQPINMLCVAAELIANRCAKRYITVSHKSPNEIGTSMSAFARENRSFMIFILGLSLVFYGQNSFCNFIINVVQSLGRDASDMGYLNAFRAGLECPFMFIYTVLRKKRTSKSLLQFSLIFFFIKSVCTAFSPNYTFLFWSQILQGFSFGIYVSAIVDYVAVVIPYKDSAKGQGLAASASTIGTIIASLITGHLFDVCSVRMTMLIASAVLLCGVIISFTGIHGIEKKRIEQRSTLHLEVGA